MTDAELLEEERKKKEAAAMGEVQPQKPITFRDYSVPELPRASGLSVFTSSGEVKPGVDVSAITSAPETLPKPSEVNTALNQEVQVGSSSVDEIPSINASARGVTRRDVSAPDQVVPAGRFGGQSDARLSDVGLSPVQGRGRITPSSVAAQAATEASASEVTPSVTPTIESPSGDAQGQAGAAIPQGEAGSPQAFFANIRNQRELTPEEIARGEAKAAEMGTTFDPNVGFSRKAFEDFQAAQAGATAPAGGLTTVGGAPLSEFLGGQAMPERGFTQPERPMAGRGVTLTPKQMDELSAEREARLEARRPGDQSVSDRDRRAAGGEGISVADRTDMAKANARGASPSEIARGNKIADELGVDLRTGQPLQPAGGLTFEQQLALRKEQRAGREEVRSVAEQEREWEQTQGEARQERMDEMNTEIGALTSIIGQAENISGVATEAGRQVGAGTTGFFSPIKWIGGTTAADLAGNLETIKSDAFVANITEMRQNSPTGGAVGNVSDKDLEMLQSLQTSFRQNLKPTTLKKNLKKYKEIRDKVARDAKAGFIRKYGAKNFNTYFGDKQQGGTQVSPIPNDRESNTQIDPVLQQYFN